MPEEYLNYTITDRNGVPWAAIDGVYPIHFPYASRLGNFGMVYPIPQGTTNISISLDGVPLNWTNLTEQAPYANHHTALGDWEMIMVEFVPSDFFTLTIHYEHPILLINGTYQFLYDLNIRSYLYPSSPNSTAYFTVKLERPVADLQVFACPSDNERNPLVYVSKSDGTNQEAVFTLTSEYSKPLPGDVLVTFMNGTDAPTQPTLEPTLEPTQTATPTNDEKQTLDLAPIVLAVVIVVAVAVSAIVYFRRRNSRP